jgi:hypothetical protein
MITIQGMQVLETLDMVDHVEDWSRVRSPGRAARRRRKHRQNIKIVAVPKRYAILDETRRTWYVHPEFMRELRNAVPLAQHSTTPAWLA